jgi:antitoxin ParD1/3/4
MHVSLTAELESRVKAKVASGLYNNASEVIREVKLAQRREQLKVGTDQLDHGEGITIASKAVLDSLFDDVKG